MSMSDVLAKNNAPSFVLYIISFNLFLMVPTALMLLYNTFSTYGCVLICTTSAQAIRDNMNGTILLGASILGGLEFLLLRRNFGKLSFSTGFLFEIVRLYSVAQLLAGMDNQLYIALNGASLISVFVSKIFYKNVNELLKKPLSQNLGQIIPALAVILIFSGSSLLSNLGLGAVSQEPNPQPLKLSNIDFSMFKTPSWNAQYFLDNILDQFQAGLNKPFTPVFNVTNNSPDPARFTSGNEKISSYLKETTYFDYKYNPLSAKAGTFFPATTGTTTRNYYIAGTPYTNQTISKPVPNSFLDQLNPTSPAYNPNVASRAYNAYNLTVTTPFNHTSLYENSLPVPWNSRTYGQNGISSNTFFGSFINANETLVFAPDGTPIATCKPLSGLASCSFFEDRLNVPNFNSISDVGLRLDGFSQSSTNDLLNYSMNYLEPDYNYIYQHAQPSSYYQSVFNPTVWSAINQTYLELPNNKDGTLPTKQDSPYSFANYSYWAPRAAQIAKQFYSPTASVMDIVNALSNAMSPSITYGGKTYPGGSLGLSFDTQFWLTQTRLSNVEGQTYPWQDGREDYVNWFLNDTKTGISTEFASSMTMILRLMGIPARFVTGYALGNTSSTASTNPYETVYQRLHKWAWTEVLVPIRTDAGLPVYEWVVVDPIGSKLAPLLGVNQLGGMTQPITSNTTERLGVLDPYYYNPTLGITSTAGQTNYANSVNRVGVDQKTLSGQYDNNDTTDNGILQAVGPKTASIINGTVHVGVFIGIFHYTGTTLTSITGAGSYNVTFQVLYFSQTNQSSTAETRQWDSTSNKTTVVSDPVTSIAQVTFTYYPFDPNATGLVPLHGISPILFVAILSATETVNSPTCRDPTTGQITCAIGYSDTNRTDDTYNNATGTVNINYDPFTLEPSGATSFNLMNTNQIASLQQLNLNVVTYTLEQQKLQLNMQPTNLQKELGKLSTPTSQFLGLGVFFAMAVTVVTKLDKIKRSSKK